MGLYDEVRCKYLLPEAPDVIQNDVFQTKDLGSMMGSFTVTEDGELIHHVHEYSEVPEEERPNYGTPGWDQNRWCRLIGSMKIKHTKDIKINHHGIIWIYTIARDHGWWEYEIKFTDGVVVDVKRKRQE